jgi:hypothetical protein
MFPHRPCRLGPFLGSSAFAPAIGARAPQAFWERVRNEVGKGGAQPVCKREQELQSIERTAHRDRFSAKEPSPRVLIVNAGVAVSFGPALIISGRAADISDLTEPSEAERRRADGAGHARRAEPVQ